jgi:hypothetical protein
MVGCKRLGSGNEQAILASVPVLMVVACLSA